MEFEGTTTKPQLELPSLLQLSLMLVGTPLSVVGLLAAVGVL